MFTTKKYHTLLLLLMLLAPYRLLSQVWEDFSDGDFNTNPSWTGDTADFRINNQQLQLYASGSDSSWLSFPYVMPLDDTITWQFWLRLAFSPTANNYAMVALYSDSANLLAASHYLVLAVIDPSASGKRIALFQDDSLLLRLDYSPSANNNPLRFKIQMTGNQLTVWIDTIGDSQTPCFSIAGMTTAVSASLPSTSHFGIYCHYTSSRSHLFYFDDIGINRSAAANDSTLQLLVPGDMLVSEVLFNPPHEGCDYVELYNHSDSAIALSRLYLAKMTGDSVVRLYPIATSGAVESHDFVVVTTDATWVKGTFPVHSPEKIVEVPTMPAYNDASGTVAISTRDTLLLDRFDYNEKMHSRLLRNREGVALERRSYDRPTQETNNWYSAASTAGFGTPTSRNSQSHEMLFVDDNFNIATPLFSPDGDGYNDLLDITWNLDECSLSANISIYDNQGRLVNKLARGALLGCQGSISWDGTNDNGNRCPRGNYLVVIEAYNESGTNQSWRRTVSLVRK